jgi:DNA-binding transcriptional MerR regulator
MEDDGSLLTIGQLAGCTGLAVRTIRYWSDIGAVPPVSRSPGGHRLYDAGSVTRLELVRTLRELGLGLEEVRRVLAQEATVADVAAAHVAALDAQIRSLRLTRAVLSAVARRAPGTEEMTLMNKLARLTAAERKQTIDDFVEEVFAGLDVGPNLRDKLQLTAPELPDDPTREQVAAWVELAELVQEPGFRRGMRTMAEYHARASAGGPTPQAGALKGFAQKMTELVGQARERGVAPDSPEAAVFVGELLGADPARRAYILGRLQASGGSQSHRYHQLLAVINGQQSRPSHAPDLEWLIAAIESHPA